VKRGCGKTCGECGKVWVFNRYFAILAQRCPQRKLPGFCRKVGKVGFIMCYVTIATKGLLPDVFGENVGKNPILWVCGQGEAERKHRNFVKIPQRT
jgi:hypothetical protein